MKEHAKNTIEKFGELSAISIIGLILISGLASAAVITSFGTVEGEVQAETPVEISGASGILSGSMVVNSGESSTGTVDLENSANVPISIETDTDVVFDTEEDEEENPNVAAVRHILSNGHEISRTEYDESSDLDGYDLTDEYKADFQHTNSEGVEFHVKGDIEDALEEAGEEEVVTGHGKLRIDLSNSIALDSNFNVEIDYRTGESHGYANTEKVAPDWLGFKVRDTWYIDYSVDKESGETITVGEDIEKHEFIDISTDNTLEDEEGTISAVLVGSGTATTGGDPAGGSQEPSDIYYQDIQIEEESLFEVFEDGDSIEIAPERTSTHTTLLQLDQDSKSGDYELTAHIKPE